MQSIQPIRTELANSKVKQLLMSVEAELGLTPNMMKCMAQSPAALEGYLRLGDALRGGELDPTFREQLALTVAQVNRCGYSLAAHTAFAGRLGLTIEEIGDGRAARGSDRKTDAGLKFARDLVARSGQLLSSDLRDIRQAGYSDEEIVEIVANVALNIYANYFNIVAGTVIDFPGVGLAANAA